MKSIQDFLETKLRKVGVTGSGFAIACCPVHKGGNERNPSFSVNLTTGKYKCYSCGISGSLSDLQKLLNTDEHLALLRKEREKREYDDNINEAILAIFNNCPVKLLDDGFDEKTLKLFEVGYDDLYGRITFPIRTPEGRLVAISGRAWPEDVMPRYKVYTPSMLRGAAEETYKPKSKNWLYGAHLLPNGLEDIYVVEGYKACIWLKQCGIDNVVATMGTMVKNEQIDVLRRLADRAILVFDMDDSGVRESKILAKRLREKGMPVIIKSYPAEEPDGLTPEQVQNHILTRRPH